MPDQMAVFPSSSAFPQEVQPGALAPGAGRGRNDGADSLAKAWRMPVDCI